MFQYRGGMVVDKGTYWNVFNGERQDLLSAGALPGNERTKYIKAPSIVVVLLGPVVGLFYVLFLPFIGLGMVLMLVAGQLSSVLYDVFGRTAAFGWRPVEAYLLSRKKKKARQKAQPEEAEPQPDSERS
jgi:hypothetical protein